MDVRKGMRSVKFCVIFGTCGCLGAKFCLGAKHDLPDLRNHILFSIDFLNTYLIHMIRVFGRK